MAENTLADASTEFAVEILKITDNKKDIIPYLTSLKEAVRV